MLAMRAVVASASSFTAIAEWAADADEDMLRALGWPDGVFGIGIPADAAAPGRGSFIT